MEASDQNLVKRIQNGDKDAFRELVERYQRKAFSIAYGMVHNREDALDLVQDSFLKAYRNIKRFEGSSSFYTWLYRIVVNVCIDHIRKSGKRTKVEFEDNLFRDDEEGSDDRIRPSLLDVDPLKVYGRKELLEKIQVALEELSPIHKQAIVLREIEGLSYTEMAEVMEVSKGTVMSRLHHARKNLQDLLSDYLQGDLAVDNYRVNEG
ncbi:MAG: sigma-70 family RNA polymerase sigma factor [Myxococcales bacterium]|nr:sigma-70 family RNA polymerase sigma factor [Myxococcales bacterium]